MQKYDDLLCQTVQVQGRRLTNNNNKHSFQLTAEWIDKLPSLFSFIMRDSYTIYFPIQSLCISCPNTLNTSIYHPLLSSSCSSCAMCFGKRDWMEVRTPYVMTPSERSEERFSFFSFSVFSVFRMTSRINSIARALFIAILAMNTFSQAVQAESGLADQVIVKKSERKLYLMRWFFLHSKQV